MSEKLEVIIPTLHCVNTETGNEYLVDLMESIRMCGDLDTLDIHIIENEPSFHDAINKGFAETTGDVVLLNDDVIVSPDFFTLLRNGMGDIRGCKTYFPDWSVQHAGGFIALDFHGAHVGYMSVDTGQYDYVCPCPFVTFAGVYVKRTVIDKIGLLTAEFGRVYFDDVDYCFRAWEAGFTVVYNPVPLIHFETASMKQKKVNVQEMYMKGLGLFQTKWASMETIDMLRDRIGKWGKENEVE